MAFIEEKLTATVPFRALCFSTGRGEDKEVLNSWLTPHTVLGSLSYQLASHQVLSFHTWCPFLNLGVAWEPHRSPGLSTIIYSHVASVLHSGHWVSATIPVTPLPIRASPAGCNSSISALLNIKHRFPVAMASYGRRLGGDHEGTPHGVSLGPQLTALVHGHMQPTQPLL